jgi:hypothetical protein
MGEPVASLKDTLWASVTSTLTKSSEPKARDNATLTDLVTVVNLIAASYEPASIGVDTSIQIRRRANLMMISAELAMVLDMRPPLFRDRC